MIEQICFNEILLDSAKEVFETMIFMDVEQYNDADQSIEGESILGSITFKGDINGCMVVCCNQLCAKIIAANMLGMDPEDTIRKEDIYDAIGEVSNMVMGSIKARIHNYSDNINVSIPMVINGKEIETNLGEGTSEKASVKVMIDSEYIAEFYLLYKGDF